MALIDCMRLVSKKNCHRIIGGSFCELVELETSAPKAIASYATLIYSRQRTKHNRVPPPSFYSN